MGLSRLLLLAFMLVAGAPAAARCYALDGDTLMCDQRRIRLANVYAAEIDQAGGREARRRLQRLVSSGHVTWRAYGEDRYGRMLAAVYVDGRRIEQSDIGPRAGYGSRAVAPRHHVRASRPKRAHRPASRQSPDSLIRR